AVSPDELYTNLGPAIRRGAECLYNYDKRNSAESYRLVLVTDGKNHPSPNYVHEYTIEQAMTAFQDFLPGRQWSLDYIALKGQIDPELLALVEKYHGSFFDVEKIARLAETAEAKVVKSIIETPDEWERFEVLIVAHTGNVKVKSRDQNTETGLPEGTPQRVYPGDQINVGAASEAVINVGPIGSVGLKENTEVSLERLDNLPLKKSVNVQIKLHEGILWNVVQPPQGGSSSYDVVTPIALTGVRGTVFRLSYDPQYFEQSVAVIDGSVEVSSREGQPSFERFVVPMGTYTAVSAVQKSSFSMGIPDKIIVEWAKWREMLIRPEKSGAKRPEEIHVCKYLSGVGLHICDPMNSLSLGPLEPGGRMEQELSLELDNLSSKTDLRVLAAADIDLPEGVECTVDVNLEDLSKGSGKVLVTARAETNAHIEDGMKWKGWLFLTSPNDDVSFSQNGILPLSIYTPDRKGVGRLIHTRPIDIKWRKIGQTLTRIITALRIPIYVASAIMSVWFMRNILYPKIFIRPHGWLLVLDRPADSQLGSMDLKSVSKRLRKPALVIGKDPASDIPIAHSSVDKHHVRIRAATRASPSPVYIKPLGVSKVKVNFSAIHREALLEDGDIIEFGDFQFLYSSPLAQKVVVHYKTGEVKYGMLQKWDADSEGFLLREDVESPPVPVSFDEIKGIFFNKRFGRELAVKMKSSKIYERRKRIVVDFLDGERIRGHIVQDYDERAPRFLIAPELKEGTEENTVLVLVERSFVKKVRLRFKKA
ncbi:MAG: FHA domain-containing protein, partial [Candidatus Lindowbacteria bacterium]|nr:FHA domain-containing protein [Candidatus Lindowbacteria bacterium]